MTFLWRQMLSLNKGVKPSTKPILLIGLHWFTTLLAVQGFHCKPTIWALNYPRKHNWLTSPREELPKQHVRSSKYFPRLLKRAIYLRHSKSKVRTCWFAERSRKFRFLRAPVNKGIPSRNSWISSLLIAKLISVKEVLSRCFEHVFQCNIRQASNWCECWWLRCACCECLWHCLTLS